MAELTPLSPGKCALMVVDIQDRLMRVINEKERVIKNASLLVKAANVLNIPVVATTQYVEKIGEILPEVSGDLNDVIPMDKMEFNCFANADISGAVKGLGNGINTLLICGVETHICVYQTVQGALNAGYKVWVPADAVSSRVEENYLTGLARISEMGATVANTEMIIYELLHMAGTAEFKEMLPHLK
jgi:nicotinamidase-related amidase